MAIAVTVVVGVLVMVWAFLCCYRKVGPNSLGLLKV
jgi:hypothetical protein